MVQCLCICNGPYLAIARDLQLGRQATVMPSGGSVPASPAPAPDCIIYGMFRVASLAQSQPSPLLDHYRITRPLRLATLLARMMH